jgi:Zn-dependent protease with chaperone function
MNFIYLFSLYPLIFAVQLTLHSFIAAVIIEWILNYWEIKNPIWQQRFLAIPILMPPLTFFLYYFIDRDHYLFNIRETYIFQSYYWIYLKIEGVYIFALLLILLFILMTFMFFMQEIFPILYSILINKKKLPINVVSEKHPKLEKILSEISFDNNYNINIIDDEDYTVYSHTGKINSIYISLGVIDKLNVEQLKGIILHEVAHIERNRKNFILILYFFRIVAFFNPIALYEFRRITQEEEKVCDFYALKHLHNKRALAEALYILYIKGRKKTVKSNNFREYSAYYHIKKRIKAMRFKEYKEENYYTLLALAIMLIILINYYII